MSPRISLRLLASQSDQRLAALAGEGHERAFEALVERYRRPLLRYCRRLRLGDARGEDVLQQAFLQAWLAFARGTDVRDVRPWLYRIVHNAAVNAMRGQADAHGELSEAAQAGAALAGESNLQRAMAVREALTDVAALPQMQQQAIFLTAVDGQSNDEVADVLGISEGALRGLLYRARTTLRGAAAALTPPPLLAWAAGGPGASAPMAERIAELSVGGGAAAGIGGLLLKGAVVAVTAGAVATGATVASSDSQGVDPAAHRSSAARSPGVGVGVGAGADRSVALDGRAPSGGPAPGPDLPERSGRARRRGSAGDGRERSFAGVRRSGASSDGVRHDDSASGSPAVHDTGGDGGDGSSGASRHGAAGGGAAADTSKRSSGSDTGGGSGSGAGAATSGGTGRGQGTSSGAAGKSGSDDAPAPVQSEQVAAAQAGQLPPAVTPGASPDEGAIADDRSSGSSGRPSADG